VREALAGERAGEDDSKTAAIQRQLADLERLLLAQDGGQVMAPAANQAGPNPLAIGNRPAPPTADDDRPALTMRKVKPSGNSAAAFLDQCFSFVGQ
jgi:hypothetical protein